MTICIEKKCPPYLRKRAFAWEVVVAKLQILTCTYQKSENTSFEMQNSPCLKVLVYDDEKLIKLHLNLLETILLEVGRYRFALIFSIRSINYLI